MNLDFSWWCPHRAIRRFSDRPIAAKLLWFTSPPTHSRLHPFPRGLGSEFNCPWWLLENSDQLAGVDQGQVGSLDLDQVLPPLRGKLRLFCWGNIRGLLFCGLHQGCLALPWDVGQCILPSIGSGKGFLTEGFHPGQAWGIDWRESVSDGISINSPPITST